LPFTFYFVQWNPKNYDEEGSVRESPPRHYRDVTKGISITGPEYSQAKPLSWTI
jgi:hypothetical protein